MQDVSFTITEDELRCQAQNIYAQFKRIAQICNNPDFTIQQLHIHVSQINTLCALPVPSSFHDEMQEMILKLGVLCDEALLKHRSYQNALKIEKESLYVGDFGRLPAQLPTIV